MSEGPVRLYYTGRGFIPGVPRRDLHDADLARLSERKLAEATAKHPRSGHATYQVTEPASRKHGKPPKQPAGDGDQHPAETETETAGDGEQEEPAGDPAAVDTDPEGDPAGAGTGADAAPE